MDYAAEKCGATRRAALEIYLRFGQDRAQQDCGGGQEVETRGKSNGDPDSQGKTGPYDITKGNLERFPIDKHP